MLNAFPSTPKFDCDTDPTLNYCFNRYSNSELSEIRGPARRGK